MKSGFKYKAYTGGAGPSRAQSVANDVVLFEWIEDYIENGLEGDCDTEVSYKLELNNETDGDKPESLITLDFGVGIALFTMSYDRWGYVVDQADAIVFQVSLKQIQKWIKDVFKLALDNDGSFKKGWWKKANDPFDRNK